LVIGVFDDVHAGKITLGIGELETHQPGRYTAMHWFQIVFTGQVV